MSFQAEREVEGIKVCVLETKNNTLHIYIYIYIYIYITASKKTKSNQDNYDSLATIEI